MKGTDPQELDDIDRLVSKPVFQKMAAYAINKRAWDVYDNGGKMMDMTELKRTFGFNNPKGEVFAHTKKMLDLAGGMNMEDLGKLIEIGEQIGKVDAPNASMFIARRGVMGGAEGILRGLVPSLGTAAAGSAAGGLAGGLAATILFMGGSHMLGRMITDPRIARPMHKVLDKEVNSIVRKGAALQIGRIFANEMIRDEEYSVSDGFKWLRNYEKTIGGLYRAFKSQPSE